jgi:hypothetical protein
MSRESTLLRGITNIDLKQVVSKAIQNGWEISDSNGSTHYYLIWPKTNEKVGFGSTISNRNYYKSFARQLERVAGQDGLYLARAKRGKTKFKADHDPKFIDTHLAPDQILVRNRKERAARAMQDKMNEMLAVYRQLQLELLVLSFKSEGDYVHSTPAQRNEAVQIIRKMSRLEEIFTKFDVPIPTLD